MSTIRLTNSGTPAERGFPIDMPMEDLDPLTPPDWMKAAAEGAAEEVPIEKAALAKALERGGRFGGAAGRGAFNMATGLNWTKEAGLVGGTKAAFAAAPVLSSLNVAGSIPLLGMLGMRGYDAISDEVNGQQARMNRQRMAFEAEMLSRELLAQEEKIQEMQQENLRRLEQMMPHLYQELSYKRRLPQGAVVFGGRRQTDALEEIARMMATGEISQADIGDAGDSFLGV